MPPLPHAAPLPLTRVGTPALLIGGAYSGKSELAMQLLAPDVPAAVLGTAKPDEPAFQERVKTLKDLRPAAWQTFDASSDLTTGLAEALSLFPQVLVDSVSQWLASVIVQADPGDGFFARQIDAQLDELTRLIRAHPKARLVLVSAEVGGGPAPSRGAERFYRQLVGRANQRLAALAQSVLLVHAGIPTMIKGER